MEKEKIKLFRFGILNYERIAYIVIVLFTVFWCITLTVKYFSFGYFDWDLAFFNQAMWNLLHGSFFSSLFNVNFFGNHANFLSFLFLPAYFLFPHALFLVYLKIFFTCAAAFPIYLLAKERISGMWGIFFIVLYFLYPPLNYALIYEFDWENLSVFFIVWMFYFYQKRNLKYFIIVSLLLLLIKENMPLVLFMFGIHALLSRRERIWSIFSLVSSGVWFFLSVFWIIPFFLSSGSHGYWGFYSILKKDLKEILGFLLIPLNRIYLFKLFSPLAFSSLLRLDILFLALPIFLQHMLSQSIMEHTIIRGYASSLVPFIFFSSILGLSFLLRGIVHKKYPSFVFACVMLGFTLISLRGFCRVFSVTFSNTKNNLNPQCRQLIRSIPDDASVITTFAFLPELSSRRHLYAFHDVYRTAHFRDPRDIPRADYALIDFNDIALAHNFADLPSLYKPIAGFFKDNEFGVITAINDVVLFKNNYVPRFKLIEEKENTQFGQKKQFLINNAIALYLDNRLLEGTPGHTVPLRFYWYCVKEGAVKYEMKLFLVNRKGKEIYNTSHSICYRIKPTSGWKQNESIVENYNFFIPNLPAGRYSLEALFFDSETGTIAELAEASETKIYVNTIAELGAFDIKNR